MTDELVDVLRLGTRRSPLALEQAHQARAAVLEARPGLAVELVELVSEGDRDPRELHVIRERGVFVHTLERALRDGEIDAAVHSSKDLALDDPRDLVLAAWLPRADPRDALVGGARSLDELAAGSCVGTGSARRMSQLRNLRPDVEPSPVRGNVQTRIDRSIARGDAACMLAMAGLDRLGLTSTRRDVHPLAVDVVVPEAGQGAIVVQSRSAVCDRTGFEWARIDHLGTRRSVQLKRRIARVLGGGCERPVGVHVDVAGGTVHAYAAADLASAGRRVRLDLVGLELAPLVSVSSITDIDDAATWVAAQLAPQLAEALGVELAHEASRAES